MNEGCDDDAYAGIAGEAVVDQSPLAALIDQAGESEGAELVARRGLGRRYDYGDVAHAEARVLLLRSGCERGEDAQARGVCEERRGLHGALDVIFAGDAGASRTNRLGMHDFYVAPIFAGVRDRAACMI